MRVNAMRTDVATVMADVLVHQRTRWGALQDHHRQFEGWWKAEMTMALANWAWQHKHLEERLWACPECKPSEFGVNGGPATADILVAKLDTKSKEFETQTRPRVWIELKERSTWWGQTPGAAAKAAGGLWADLEKWGGVKEPGEIVLVCQVTTHDGTLDGEPLPKTWQEELAEVAKVYKHAIEPRCVGYEVRDTLVRWTRFDCFVVNSGE